MRFTITSQGTSRPLELDMCGYHLEVLDMDTGSISVSDADGRLAVCYIEPQTVQAVMPEEQVSVDDAVDAADSSDCSQVDSAQSDTLQVVEAETPQVIESHSIEDLEQLFQHLVTLRRQIASELKLPPYIIFHDSTLRDMCRLLPSDLQELRAVQGVGQAKLEKYGLRFIQAIHGYISDIKGVA